MGSNPSLPNFSAAAGGGAKVGRLGFEPPTTRTPVGCVTTRPLPGFQRRASLLLGAVSATDKNPNCVYLSDCLLAGSGTDWLTVNLSSRCTAEGNRIFETCFYDIVITQNDHPRYLKHVLGRIHVFLTLFGHWAHEGGGGVPRDWYTTC